MDIINTASSGAQAARARMNASAMNLANLKTPGYSRQQADQSAIGPSGESNSAGGGVQIDRLRRIADSFLTRQLWGSNSKSEYCKKDDVYLSPLEKILGNSNTGLAEGVDKFFATLNGATTQPDNPANRQAIVGEAQAMATRFNNVNRFIQDQRRNIHSERRDTVQTVNTLTKNIASYNDKISALVVNGDNANVMRDQRDELVKQLSNFMDVNVQEDSKGSYTVSLNNGETLVSGKNVGTLSVEDRPNGSQGLALEFCQVKNVINMACGGKLGAMNDYENNTLSQMRSEVNGMAESLTKQVNDQLAKGFDLNGKAGKPLFVFDAKSAVEMLKVTALPPADLALSDKQGVSGNGGNLLALIDIKNRKFSVGGSSPVTLGDRCTAMINVIGMTSRQNKSEALAANDLFQQAQTRRDNLSAVNSEEEAINLQSDKNEYQANLKVIATGDKIFSELLALF
ncbi:flagellar hook-associated protein FlgK [Rouxiella chamberiensis]|uniref:Flagellar hook-associated protein 1 n=1 Tax=Rouxiella chamberiensis TaxID=1513468 RepID=A0ABY7HMP6_9GAMM|nr:flagellar hook-associated protein FlgK [Rouxiella chamberiensis]WAT00651.1 flagellar hook-associated protein FlgK [Rouxiella chamberiensis]